MPGGCMFVPLVTSPLLRLEDFVSAQFGQVALSLQALGCHNHALFYVSSQCVTTACCQSVDVPTDGGKKL